MEASIRTRLLAMGLAATIGTTGLAVFSMGSAAVAAPHYSNAPTVQVGYTDSATPTVGYDRANNVSMPLGTRVDETGKAHRSRVYATFNLTPYHGKRIVSTSVVIRETEVADCTKRSIELWQTRQIELTPSWDKAPKEKAKLDEISTAQSCPATITFDVGSAITEAVAQQKNKITFELRVAAGHEADPAYFRMLSDYYSVTLSVRYNSVPAIDDRHMYNGGFLCDPAAPPRRLNGYNASLQALGSDPDQNDADNHLKMEFAVWPENNPAARKVYQSSHSRPGRVAGVRIPDSDYVDGQAYAWQYRATDGLDWSGWSKSCHIIADRTMPSAPEVTSSNYPRRETGQQTPLGEPGVFTFSGGGNPDVAGFEYRWEMIGVPVCSAGSGSVGQDECPEPLTGQGIVRADSPGGSATVLISPDRETYNTLKVRSIDAAGNRSGETEYQIFAPWQGRPGVALVGDAEWNHPVTVTFRPATGITGTVKYTYALDYGPEQTIAAAADGTATITFTATSEYGHHVDVRSHSANGWISPNSDWQLDLYPWPTVKSDLYVPTGEPAGGVGILGTFVLSPPSGWVETKGYEYSFNGGERAYVAAGPDGKASFTWAPSFSGGNYLEVWGVRPDGTVDYYSNFYTFEVA